MRTFNHESFLRNNTSNTGMTGSGAEDYKTAITFLNNYIYLTCGEAMSNLGVNSCMWLVVRN